MLLERDRLASKAANSGRLKRLNIMQSGKGAGLAALTFVFIAAVAAFTILQVHTPEVVSASAPANQFSGARALQQVRAFAQKPHAIGSAAQAAVRQYITGRIAALGVTPEVQT